MEEKIMAVKIIGLIIGILIQLAKPMFRDLYVCFYGTAECYSGYSFGPAVRPNYIIHYITSGKDIYQVGN